MPLRALIVDDEPLNRDELKYLLSLHKDIVVAGEAGHAAQAQQLIEQVAPDLVLLDIQMGSARAGLELAEAIKKNPNPPSVIFVTAHLQHALEAFDHQAIHYLLKPIDEDKLAEALTRVRERYNSQWIANANYDRMADIMRSLTPPNKRLEIKHRDKDRVGNAIRSTAYVPVDEILFIHKTQLCNETEVHLNDSRVLQGVHLTLTEFEMALADHNFFRIHNGYLVNLAHVRGITKRFSDQESYDLLLRECLHEIPISQNKLAALKEKLEK
jgi:DNA-binding LytR/AlgR family response regulator